MTAVVFIPFFPAVTDLSAAANIITSVPFLIAGLAGVYRLVSGPKTIRSYGSLPLAVFVLSLLMIGAGSILYHAAPSPWHLLWDRLPIALSLAAFTCALINLYAGPRTGSVLLLPLLTAALGSVLYWYGTWMHGSEDLRPYAAVQGGATLFAVVFSFVRPWSAAGIASLRAALACYGGGRIFELFQQQIYDRLGIDLGHPLKHLLVALAAWLMLRGLFAAMGEQERARTEAELA